MLRDMVEAQIYWTENSDPVADALVTLSEAHANVWEYIDTQPYIYSRS